MSDTQRTVMAKLLPVCYDRDKIGTLTKCLGKENDKVCECCGFKKDRYSTF
jgi:hypothetical protein